MEAEHFDVLIIGAGLSGIGAAWHLQKHCPGKTYAVLEGRAALGGTWDLFRYPGIRSDSDMYTLGYSFKPWTNAKAIADGPSILEYIRETAAENGIDRHIRYEHRVERASWSSATARWTLTVRDLAADTVRTFTCSFIFACVGYYDYDAGYTPEFPGMERFAGRIVHPQSWTPDVEYAGKRVVLIGSGATAVTLVPELAREAAHVTMLQRSPTFLFTRPEADVVADWLRAHVPMEAAYAVVRWKNVLLGMAFFAYCRRFPAAAKKFLVDNVHKELGGFVDFARHFTPDYGPWDQRVCLVRDGDLFEALRDGRASIVTDHVETFTEKGVRLRSGKELEADLVVTATGLKVKFMGGIAVDVDGRTAEPNTLMTYKGMMCSDVPNLAFAIGYTNASWTLKCDLTSEYACRLIDHMDRHGYVQCVPRRRDPTLREAPLLDFTSGYVQRAAALLPKQGSRAPWKLYQNYVFDLLTLRRGRVDDGEMEFSRAGQTR